MNALPPVKVIDESRGCYKVPIKKRGQIIEWEDWVVTSKYRVIKHLGSGTYGDVVRAQVPPPTPSLPAPATSMFFLHSVDAAFSPLTARPLSSNAPKKSSATRRLQNAPCARSPSCGA
jgi:hypothetical protein